MAYAGGAEYDHQFYRVSHRGNSRPVYYSRAPYEYLEPARHQLRGDYEDEIENGAPIRHAIDDGQGGQQARRRIAVACARCRRRKIKCSGDTQAGQGCSACRSSGADIVKDCTFNRVGSNEVGLVPGFEMILEGAINMATQAMSYPATTVLSGRHRSAGLHRASLPALHTRSGFPPDADVQYEASPIEAYAYASSMTPRQDSFASAYRLEDYRSWPSATEAMSAPTMSQAYESHAGLPYGSTTIPAMVVPNSQHNMTRLPSVSAEAFTALNMGHLNTALPGQNVYARRLPIPPPPHDPPMHLQYSAADIPEIRPLESVPTAHQLNSMQSRNGSLWNGESTAMSSSSLPMTTYAALPNGLPHTSLPPAASLAESAYGYVCHPMLQPMLLPTISTSPDGSPESTVSVESYDGSPTESTVSLVQPDPARFSTTMSSALPMMITADDLPTSSHGDSACLYSNFSNERNNTEVNETYGGNGARPRNTWPTGNEGRPSVSYQYSTSHSYPHSGYNRSFGSDGTNGAQIGSSQSALPLHQPQPQHSGASIETLCRQSSFQQPRSPAPQQQQQQSRHDHRDRHDRRRQASTAQSRMSLANFNAPY